LGNVFGKRHWFILMIDIVSCERGIVSERLLSIVVNKQLSVIFILQKTFEKVGPKKQTVTS
jgi:hypothetical protein